MSTIENMTTAPKLGVVRLETDAKLPTKAHYGDLGYDLYALEDVTLEAGKVTLVRTGIACNFPPGYGALLRDRSSVATKVQVFVVAGVIDQGYTGEIKVAFSNPAQLDVTPLKDCEGQKTGKVNIGPPVHKTFKAGDKIAQMILIPVITIPVDEVTEVQGSSRGDKGFGSSGV